MKRVFSIRYVVFSILVIVWASCVKQQPDQTTSTADTVKTIRDVWSKEKAQEWYKQWGWLRGSDFIPSTAINQLEMWQAETFDTATINRELGYAESIGLNSMRVYLHHLAWQIDSTGFKNRVD